MNKKELAMLLAKIRSFEKPKAEYEQYQTPSDLAANALWQVYMDGNVVGKTITDLGSGTGIFGIGALILEAKRVIFVDADKDALKTAKENKKYIEESLRKRFNANFVNRDIIRYKGKSDVLIQNPPFGVQKPHIDKSFLQVAMNIAPIIYSFHKIESKNFIDSFARDNGFKVASVYKMGFPLKAIFHFHTKKNYFVDVGFWKIVKTANRKV